jgi:carbonic anhydrase
MEIRIKLTRAAVEANVVVQMNNIATHPSVARAIVCNSINLNGWVYDLETTDILVYDKTHKRFTEA